MPRNAGDYVKSWGAALIRGAASNPEFTVVRTWVSDAHCRYPEVLSTCRAQLNVVAVVVVDSGLGQHSVVLDLTLPIGDKHIFEYENHQL